MKKDNNKDWKFVSEYSLKEYPCGLIPGDKLKIVKEIIITDHEGQPTGEIFQVGEIWTVLSGVPDEPDIIWLRQANGERHTWDEVSIFEYFEKQ